ncbi:HupE/UreJ family protein [Pelagibacterium halotolerans]|uniref:HupE-UreJ family metal transporter n=1 Tax=Pelagibacterium halotolerans (strain DSM 22347 / JCM 15775 / CGMCC 1.7692 / B2) TaxID=1082931 RepID=G4RA46_PELHB|nr:HupE/UreJ family protein [Pelagibacterium halotolerans]AEQ53529.1 HupE-UreJ family metal transporter [Pelagibacterium halotolerans B2]QJR20293.1 HupE/UreJ family protein [Pelagibacterium halotolerans]SEA58155.1 urease accessory protein [Pelagibacterium halotolerans]
MFRRIFAALVLVVIGTAPAFAHLDPVEHGSFAAGFTHPLFGFDHILAMVAVGLWAASVGGKALWAVPAAFVATMAVGFGAALAGMPLPFVEPVILASVIFIGIMVALALPLPTTSVAAVVAFFALFHGHAHGGEMGEAGALGYAGGFLLATALLHTVGVAAGVGLGRILATTRGVIATRIAGGLTALGGLWLVIAG